jgi:hypothetical protein
MISRKYICPGCSLPREKFKEAAPGRYQYDPCQQCGTVGIERADEVAREVRPAKQKRPKR